MTTKSYFFTTAPASYDYGRTTTIAEGIVSSFGDGYRLVCVTERDPQGTFLADYQCGRYWSGMHRPWPVDSVDASNLGLPPLSDFIGADGQLKLRGAS